MAVSSGRSRRGSTITTLAHWPVILHSERVGGSVSEWVGEWVGGRVSGWESEWVGG